MTGMGGIEVLTWRFFDGTDLTNEVRYSLHHVFGSNDGHLHAFFQVVGARMKLVARHGIRSWSIHGCLFDGGLLDCRTFGIDNDVIFFKLHQRFGGVYSNHDFFVVVVQYFFN